MIAPDIFLCTVRHVQYKSECGDAAAPPEAPEGPSMLPISFIVTSQGWGWGSGSLGQLHRAYRLQKKPRSSSRFHSFLHTPSLRSSPKCVIKLLRLRPIESCQALELSTLNHHLQLNNPCEREHGCSRRNPNQSPQCHRLPAN